LSKVSKTLREVSLWLLGRSLGCYKERKVRHMNELALEINSS